MPAQADTRPTLAFDPDAPMDWTPHWHSDVSIHPWGSNDPGGYKRSAGMFDADGHIADSHCWRYHHETATIIPEVDDADRELPHRLTGKWLFGGLFYAHFGHFLVESTSRLWGIEGLEDIEGFVFYPKLPLTHELKPLKPYRPFFEKLGLGRLKIRMPQRPLMVDQIAFPPPGIGIGEMIAGRPEYRRFMRQRLLDGIDDTGGDDIYVSRTALASRRGRIVMERHLEALMKDAGYRVIHPETLDISEQIATYRGARRIVALDGSALHLAAMVASPGCRVAIINRGPSENIEDYILQFKTFSGVAADRIDAIRGCWGPRGRSFKKREAQADMDFAKAGDDLAALGFLDSATAWVDPPAAELEQQLAAVSAVFGAELDYLATG